MKRKLAFIFIGLTILLTFALVLAGQGAAQLATPTPTIRIGFGCIAGCTPVAVPPELMPTSAPTPEPMLAVRVRIFLPSVTR